MGGGEVRLQGPYQEGLRAQTTPHITAALLFATERGSRRSITCLFLSSNKHNECKKAKLDSLLHYSENSVQC